MENIKIIHIALGKANPNRQNGVNKMIFELASTQSNLGYNVEFWGITKDVKVNFPPRVFATYLFEDKKNKFQLDSKLISEIQKIASDEQRCIFHLHGSFTPQLIRVAQEIKKVQLNYIITPHGAYNQIAIKRSFFRKKIFSFLYERKYIQQASIIHLLGETEVIGLNKIVSRKNYCLIPNGQKAFHIDIQITHSSIRFGYVGRIDTYGKGLVELIHGFHQFASLTKSNCELHFIGDGPEKEQLEKLVKKLNIENQVVFHGSLFDVEKWKIVTTFTSLILPSRGEGIPGVVLEALYLGIPSIVSKETNLSELIQMNDAGLELENISPNSISKALKRVYDWDETTWNTYSSNAKELIQKEFDWKIISKKLMISYLENC